MGVLCRAAILEALDVRAGWERSSCMTSQLGTCQGVDDAFEVLPPPLTQLDTLARALLVACCQLHSCCRTVAWSCRVLAAVTFFADRFCGVLDVSCSR